jgi:hypothetical protein
VLKSGQTIRLHNLPRFVRTRGGAYTFVPSIPAIRYLGALGKADRHKEGRARSA